jgi:hypothetical protein
MSARIGQMRIVTGAYGIVVFEEPNNSTYIGRHLNVGEKFLILEKQGTMIKILCEEQCWWIDELVSLQGKTKSLKKHLQDEKDIKTC